MLPIVRLQPCILTQNMHHLPRGIKFAQNFTSTLLLLLLQRQIMTVWSYCLELQMQNNLEDTDENIELICSHLSKLLLWPLAKLSVFYEI